MRRTFALALVTALTAFGCSGSSSDPTGPSGSGGTLNLRITDSPFGSAKAVLVTFSEVAMHRDGDWKKVPFADGSSSTWTCDLKKLENNAEDLLGTGRLDPGHYTMIRLHVQSAKVYHDNSAVSSTPCARSIPEPAGGSASVTIPSGEVMLNGTYTVTSDAATTVLVDFDGESSLKETGAGYLMTPVIRLVSVK